MESINKISTGLNILGSQFDGPNTHRWDGDRAMRLVRLCENASKMTGEEREDFLENVVYDALSALVDSALDSLPLPLKADDVKVIIESMSCHIFACEAEDLVKTAVECAYTSQSENAYLRFSFARPDWRGEK